MTREELQQLKIEVPDREIAGKIKRNWDLVAKPLDSLGEFENITAQIGAIWGSESIDISKKAVVVMCADNGIVEEGISQSGQEVTAAVCASMGRNKSSVGKLSGFIGADVFPINIGICGNAIIEGVINKRIASGTKNFRKEAAMTQEETLEAIQIGIDIVYMLKEQGYRVIATGEMGIGNTTTSSAVAAALTGCSAEEVTGRGAGLSDKGYQRKKQIIREALEKYSLYDAEPLQILQIVGGLDIAGLVGIFIGGGIFRIPIVMDGIISGVSALTAQRLVPGVGNYIIPSHKSKEPAMEKILEELLLKPVLDAGMALGEGTGAVMMLGILDMIMSLYEKRTTFDDIKIDQYQRFDREKG